MSAQTKDTGGNLKAAWDPESIDRAKTYPLSRAIKMTGLSRDSFERWIKAGFFKEGEMTHVALNEGRQVPCFTGESLIRFRSEHQPRKRKSKRDHNETPLPLIDAVTALGKPCSQPGKTVSPDLFYASSLAAYLLGRSRSFISRLIKDGTFYEADILQLPNNYGNLTFYYSGKALLRVAHDKRIVVKYLPGAASPEEEKALEERTESLINPAKRQALLGQRTEHGAQIRMAHDEIKISSRDNHYRVDFSRAHSAFLIDCDCKEAVFDRYEPSGEIHIIASRKDALEKGGYLTVPLNHYEGNRVRIDSKPLVTKLLPALGVRKDGAYWFHCTKLECTYKGMLLFRIGAPIDKGVEAPEESIDLMPE